MLVKDKFELVYTNSGEVINILPFSKSTLVGLEVEKTYYDFLSNLVMVFSKTKNFTTLTEIIQNNLKSVKIINLPSYPLPGFITKDGIPVINLSVLPKGTLIDYTASDIFVLFVYAISLKIFMITKPFNIGTEINIINMYFSIFMKLFGKKAGLIGSYKNLIPTLRFLIEIYVKVSLMGYKQNKVLFDQISNSLFINYSNIKLDYDFTKISEFIKSINDNGIIPISINKFSNVTANTIGLYSLPIFEDVSRFYSTMLVSKIPNTIFSYYPIKVNSVLSAKIIDICLETLKKSRI